MSNEGLIIKNMDPSHIHLAVHVYFFKESGTKKVVQFEFSQIDPYVSQH